MTQIVIMNTNPPDLQTTTELLKIRSILEKISQASWSFSVLSKQYPLQSLDQKGTKELVGAYRDIIESVIKFLKSEYEPEPRKTA